MPMWKKSRKSIRESLIEHKDLADLSKTLATIKTDCELQLDYEQARAEGFYTPEAYTLCKRLEFKICWEDLKRCRRQ